LSILESLVHLKREEIPPSQYLVHIEFPEENPIAEVSYKKIQKHWNEELEYTQWLGDQFLRNNKALVMKVPSVIVPQENNFILNPLHPKFKNVKIIHSELLQLDKRLTEY
jgi:RES domain-containing protein